MNLPPTLLSSQTQGQGHATTVVMLHSSSGRSAQWGALLSSLASDAVNCIAPDLHGHGRSPAWPEPARDTLALDADAAWRSVAWSSRDVHLVAHSYGAAVALQMALMQPGRVASLTLYEPVPFGLLQAHGKDAAALVEIEIIAERVGAWLDAGRTLEAARLFTDYWAGSGAFALLQAPQRARIAERMPTVRRHFNALFAVQWSAPQLRRLTMPVMLLRGTTTREPARALASRLATLLPTAHSVTLPGAGHLGPISHATMATPMLAWHLRSCLRGVQVPTRRSAALHRLAA